MSLITTASFNSDLLPKLIKKWFGEYNDLPEIFPRYMQVESMDQAYDIERSITPMGAMQRKNQGSVLNLDTAAEFYKTTYVALAYALGFAITKEMVRDGNAFKEAKRFTEMLRRAGRVTKELLSASVVNNVNNSNNLGGDGVVFASASHPTANGNLSNILASASDLSEAALEALNIQIMNAVDNRGIRIGLMPDKLLISPTQKAEAHRILASDLRVQTSNNDTNFLKDANVVKEVVVNPYFTSTKQWQVTVTGVSDGMKLKVRQEMEMDTDNDFMTKNGLYSADMRLVASFTDWRYLWISLGT